MEKLSYNEMVSCTGGGTTFSANLLLITGLSDGQDGFRIVVGPDAAAGGAETALYKIVVKNGMNLPNVGIINQPRACHSSRRNPYRRSQRPQRFCLDLLSRSANHALHRHYWNCRNCHRIDPPYLLLIS